MATPCQELEQLQAKLSEDAQAVLSREVAAAQERGRGSAQVAAQQEKAVLQEQITFLKIQLQYALKVGGG